LLAEQGQFYAMKGVMPDGEVARLPAGWQVDQVIPLHVPDLAVERHLLKISRH
jgi:16S rRNA (guanine527-N7)-methyltransferase